MSSKGTFIASRINKVMIREERKAGQGLDRVGKLFCAGLYVQATKILVFDDETTAALYEAPSSNLLITKLSVSTSEIAEDGMMSKARGSRNSPSLSRTRPR